MFTCFVSLITYSIDSRIKFNLFSDKYLYICQKNQYGIHY